MKRKLKKKKKILKLKEKCLKDDGIYHFICMYMCVPMYKSRVSEEIYPILHGILAPFLPFQLVSRALYLIPPFTMTFAHRPVIIASQWRRPLIMFHNTSYPRLISTPLRAPHHLFTSYLSWGIYRVSCIYEFIYTCVYKIYTLSNFTHKNFLMYKYYIHECIYRYYYFYHYIFFMSSHRSPGIRQRIIFWGKTIGLYIKYEYIF